MSKVDEQRLESDLENLEKIVSFVETESMIVKDFRNRWKSESQEKHANR